MSSSVFTDLERASSDVISISSSTDSDQKISAILELLRVIKNIKSGDKSRVFLSDALLKVFRYFLVDIDRKIRVQSCRAMRYLTINNHTLSSLIRLNIPYFMCICLEREGDNKFYWERLGALKWIRHLIDDYPLSMPRCCVMSLISIATNGKHEYRRICIDSLRTLCIVNPQIINKCNGFKVLIDLVLNPQLNELKSSLLLTILYILDHPNTRKYLRPSLDIQCLVAPFVGVNPYKVRSLNKQQIEQRDNVREGASKTLMTMLKSITGIFYLAADNYSGKSSNNHLLRILIDLMRLPNNIDGIQWSRKTMFSVLENVINSKLECQSDHGPNLIVNYVCLILMALIKNGLIECLVEVGMRSDLELAPRARTLLQRIQFLSAKYLPPKLCSAVCSIPQVINDAALFNIDSGKKLDLQITVKRNFANMIIAELTEDASLDQDMDGMGNENERRRNDASEDDSDDDDERQRKNVRAQTICYRLGSEFDLNSTFIRYQMLDRDIPSSMMFRDRIPYHSHRQKMTSQRNNFSLFSFKAQKSAILQKLMVDQHASYSENEIVDQLKQTNVLSIKQSMAWNMDKIWKLLNGPLWNQTSLQIAINKKFIKRLLVYLKPSKHEFCMLEWSVSNIRHAQCAAQLFRLLTSCEIGVTNQHFVELVHEIFDCLKDQIQSNLKKKGMGKHKQQQRPFSKYAINYTLSRTYIILIGILSESQRGMHFFKKHHMFPFLFPLTTKEITEHHMEKNRVIGPNDYLLRLIATNLDYTVDGEFPLLFSQWIAKGSYYLRKTLITHLELLYRAQMPKFDEWSINVLTILLKSEQRLALTALKVLEKINLSQNSIKSQQYLIDLIHTHPTDDVIGEYGQFLFIKMLSTVEGLKFLSKDNWLKNKRQEWSNKMHTKYTSMLETALVLSVSSDLTEDDAHDKNSEENEWLPYHLIYENRSDEEELYAEYTSHFPWSLSVIIIYESGQEEVLNLDTFWDFNGFVYKQNKQSPISLGAGICGIICDENGCAKSKLISDKCKIKISLNIGKKCLNEVFNRKALTKIVSMKDIVIYNECNMIEAGENELFCFFDQQRMHRIFWCLADGVDENTTNRKFQSVVRPLPHFYGELAKTKEGCTYILSNDDFNIDLQQFILTVHSAYLEMIDTDSKEMEEKDDDNYMIDSKGSLVDRNSNLQLRSCLWALGQIGSSKTGLTLLNSLCKISGINIIDDICILTKQSHTLSVRGTCLYVLGLLSRTQSGMTQLKKYGFGFPADNLQCDLAVAIPEDIDQINDFFKLSTTNYVDPFYIKNTKISCFSPPALCRPGNMKPLDPSELLGKSGHTEETILAHISSLSNNVTQKSSASALHTIRTKKPSVFTNPLLFREVLKILSTYQFKLAAKRFILFTLFDQVILDEGEQSLDLFDANMDDPILPFKQIREWRFKYKQSLIEMKANQQQQRAAAKQQQQQQQQQHSHVQHQQQPQIKLSYIIKSKKKQQQQNRQSLAKKKSMPPPVPASIKHKYGSYKKQESQFDEYRGRQRSDASSKGMGMGMNPPPPNPSRVSQKYANHRSSRKKKKRVQRKSKNLSNNFGGNYDGQELADSATTELAGPNPLEADQSIVDMEDN